MSQLKDNAWLDFSPRTTKRAKGHYLPLHQAWSNAAVQNGLDWTLISGNFSPLGPVADFGNLVNWPAHFTISDVTKFSDFLNQQPVETLNILVYEGDFVTFYYFLFVSRLCRKKLNVYFNWSNNNQLQKYKNKFWFKYHMNIINMFSKRSFVHYVENEALRDTLNIESNLYFNLFPTSTVFNIEKSQYIKNKTEKISLFINDKDITQVEFDKIIKRIEQFFQGMVVNIFSNYEFKVCTQMSNTYVTYSRQIDNSAYFLALNGTWISFFFYNEDNYRFLTSGRFLDCLFVKSLVVAPYGSTHLDWLGRRFGNFYHVNVYDELSNQDIEKLFEMNTEVSKAPFSPGNTILQLLSSSEDLKKRSQKKSFVERIFHHTILFCLFFILQSKFILLLITKRLNKIKTSTPLNRLT